MALHYTITLLGTVNGYSVILQSSVSTKQCVDRSMCLQSNVSTQQCVYRAMCLQSNVSTQQCVYTVPYETGVMLWLIESSYFVSAYTAPKVDKSINTKLTNYTYRMFESLIYTKYCDPKLLFFIMMQHIIRVRK